MGVVVEFVGFSNVVLVGEGGLGRVYRAEKDSTGGVVAIKELTDVAEGSAAWHRARRELEAMLRLKGHPYVVSIEEILQGPNGPLLVMEYLPGGSLAERVETGPLPAPEIVLVGQHVTQALAAAHDVGIVHRDIKPHNLLIGGFGQIKVCDFGISALARGDGRTQTNAMTMAYAAPEELDGDEHIGPPADIYSLSATLLHLITGQRPTFRDRMSRQLDHPRQPRPRPRARHRHHPPRTHPQPQRPPHHQPLPHHLRPSRSSARTSTIRSLNTQPETPTESTPPPSGQTVADTIARAHGPSDEDDATQRRATPPPAPETTSKDPAGHLEGSADPVPTPPTPADGPQPVARRHRRLLRTGVGFGAVAAVVVAFFVFSSWARSGWFVAFNEQDQAVIYRGSPGRGAVDRAHR